jgi:aspartate dehydrogenase
MRSDRVVTRQETSLERAMLCEDVPQGEAERDEVARPVETIDEAVERGRVARRIEVAHERPRGCSHRGEHPFERAPEEVHATVREARGEQRDDLPIARVGVAHRELNGVAVEARRIVELTIETVEGIAQRLHGANGSDARLDWHGAGPIILSAHMKTVGIVGLGAIGKPLCRALDAGIRGLTLAGAFARDQTKGEAFLKGLRRPTRFLALDALIAASDLVIEASTQAHLEDIAPKTLGAGKDLVVLSCGALLRHKDWIDLAEAKGCRIYVPSGAICGLDGIKGARAGAVTSVTLEMRKPPRGLAGAPYVEQNRIDLDAITEETLIFDGPATEACPAFPANVNILAALSLAGIGPDLTRLKLYAVPGLTRNTHRVTAEGEFGRFSLEIANVPSDNPRTGKLSYLSTIALLRDLGATLRVGT